MNGILGAWFAGDGQVGGFFNWELLVDTREVSAGHFMFHKWNATAQMFWVAQRFTECEVQFWQGDVIWKSPISILLPEVPLDCLITKPLSFSGKEILECKTKA